MIHKKVVIILAMLLVFLMAIFSLFLLNQKVSLDCGDGTLNGDCSLRKPYICLEGSLIEKSSSCGCPEKLEKEGGACVSEYQNNPKAVSLNYILKGDEGKIDFVAYEGVVDYLWNLPQSIHYYGDDVPSRRDFKLRNINDEEQREMLLPLVTEIQNVAKDKDDQVRIAISLVQNIPYEVSENVATVGRANAINASRYPYEVLYDNRGVCEGKSELLAFLLKEMGYGVVLFYYPSENHEAVGIKCPREYSLESSSYCFIETTGVSILSDSQGDYLGWGKLSSNPEIILISEGDSLGSNLYEYNDAKDFIRLNKIIEDTGELNIFRLKRLESLRYKYGLL
jgi:hypothetical protein